MQFSKTIEDALTNLRETDRTVSVFLGIGSGLNNTYRMIEYAETEFNVYGDSNWYQDACHPRKEGMVWVAFIDDKPCFANHFNPAYGHITP